MRLWTCPICGSSVRAPERPRKDDVRRFCKDCSWETGFLVPRVSPALERRRAATAARTRERTVARRERKRAAERDRWLVSAIDADGTERTIDVRRELRAALFAMGFFDGWAQGHRPKMNDLEVTIRRSRTREHSTGRATNAGFSVVFTFGTPTSYEEALELIYHEAAHMAAPIGERHGAVFRRILADALQARWPFLVYGRVSAGAVYDADKRIVEQMKDHVRDGGVL